MNSENSPSFSPHDRVSAWLTSGQQSCLPLTPPPDGRSKRRPAPSKRKRAISLPTNNRSNHPKRQRTYNSDDIQPEQSASQIGSENPLALNTKNTFSPSASRVSSALNRSSSRSSPGRSESPAAIREDQLSSFTPSVNFADLGQAPRYNAHIPESLLLLVKRFRSASTTSLPITLNEHDETKLNIILSNVAQKASEWRSPAPPEPHWISVVVGPLLHLLEGLSAFGEQDPLGNSNLNVMNISTTEISPSHLCMLSADGTLADLNKKIDYAVGLNLSLKAVRTLQDVKKSINQTTTFMNHTPIFLNVEVKRYASVRNPRVQLAAWIAAEFNKRQLEGWPLDMPVLALDIEQDSWLLHIVAAEPRKKSPGGFILHFFGPIRMGDTFSECNTKKLFSNLCEIALWGQEHFRHWVETEILARYADPEEE